MPLKHVSFLHLNFMKNQIIFVSDSDSACSVVMDPHTNFGDKFDDSDNGNEMETENVSATGRRYGFVRPTMVWPCLSIVTVA
jgi:hypothetical protein